MAVDLKNIQGDIWPRLPKKAQIFYFFKITNPKTFKPHLKSIIPMITTGQAAADDRFNLYQRKFKGEKGMLSMMSLNISFSAKGLAKLGRTDIGDDVFKSGMYNDMVIGGIDDDQDWDKYYKGYNGQIDGMINLAGDTLAHLENTMTTFVLDFFGANKKDESLRVVHTETGQVLPNDIEHFGWVDGISQPAIKGLDEKPKEGEPDAIPSGVIFIGAEDDYSNQPAWAKDSSFMVYRRLKQLVPEFTCWCGRECVNDPESMSNEDYMSALRQFSSRLVGRWPEGAPLEKYPDHAPTSDDIENPVNKLNNFDFGPDVKNQAKCPFSAHIRKVRPRKDFPDDYQAIIRRGIPYGDLTDNSEKAGGQSLKERGLQFVCYQSNLRNGFRFITKEWANKTDFPDNKTKECGGTRGPGIDPIIGQVRVSDYPTPVNVPAPLQPVPNPCSDFVNLERFVIAEGGEYLFTPSMSALRDVLTK